MLLRANGCALTAVADRSAAIRPSMVLGFAVMRDEMAHLGGWLDHYRRLGVGHFLIVDNASSDGTAEILAQQDDVSLWSSTAPYRDARFGMDWMNHLLHRYGRGHWCLTADADELLRYPHDDRRDLHALTARLDQTGAAAMGALMLETYPKGPIGAGGPMVWFDPGPYRTRIQQPKRNRWVQGGPRDRLVFADQPQMAPTLNKIPLIRWRRGYGYVNSTHSALPRRLNDAYDGPGDARLSGVLLHLKFHPGAPAQAARERARAQHFHTPPAFAAYYDWLEADPDLWFPGAERLTGWRQLVELGLMGDGGWT